MKGKMYLWSEDVFMKGKMFLWREDVCIKRKMYSHRRHKQIPGIFERKIKRNAWKSVLAKNPGFFEPFATARVYNSKGKRRCADWKMYLWSEDVFMKGRCIYEREDVFMKRRCVYEGEDVFMKGKMYLWREDVFMKGEKKSWNFWRNWK